MPKYPKKDREEAAAELRALLKPGDTLHTILRHVSRSGMTRHIDVVKLETDDDGQPYHLWLSWKVSRVTGHTLTDNGPGRDAVKVEGAGMDMGFGLVYELSRTLFPDGFVCIGDRCPANDHSNDPRAEYVEGVTVHEHAGGYALRQRWL